MWQRVIHVYVSKFIHSGGNYAHKIQYMLVSSKVLKQGFCSANVSQLHIRLSKHIPVHVYIKYDFMDFAVRVHVLEYE